MKMKMNAAERIYTLEILPKEGSFVTLKILKDLQDKLSFTEKEYKEMDIKVKKTESGEEITWNSAGGKELDIEIGEKASDIISEALKELDSQNKLSMKLFSLYNKFVNVSDVE